MAKISDDFIARRVHFGFTDNQLKAGLVASVAATFLATMFGEWFFAVGWIPFSFNTLNAEVWATNFKTLSGFFPITTGQLLSPDFTYFLGMWSHYSQGIVFGLIFTMLVYPNLPGPMKVGNNLVKGLIWGWTLWIVSSSFVMPLLYGTGFWFQHWGTAFGLGVTNLIFYNFVWHSTYGFVLGMFFSPAPKPDAAATVSTPVSSGGSISHWGQVVLGWIILIVGGYISSSSGSFASTGAYVPGANAAYGIIVGLIGLAIATGPSFAGMRKK
ncbi:MAG: hypothetical protein OK422_03880 [Thaumarchaeota archaeon]|nr:hypothetical protein [Nitrososphaerota archaeon]